MRFGRVFYALVILICILEIVRLWNIAPPQMAAHFNVQGNPDRFVSRPEFFRFQIQTLLVVILISLPLQILFQVLPASWINMPHREYWLASERRTETLGRLSSFAALLFGMILLIVQAVFELSVYANLQTPIFFQAGWMSMFMIASFGIIILMLVYLVLSFRLPSSRGEEAFMR